MEPGRNRQGLTGGQFVWTRERTADTAKLFTSTNESNLPMRHLCERLGYVRSGFIENLDEGDPEIVYFKANNVSIDG